MATDPLLLALLNSSGGAELSDIGNFQKTIAGNDLYKLGASSLLGSKFDTSTWSPGAALGVTALQGFLGGALGAYGKYDEGQQLQKVADALPALNSNPLGVSAPEGVDPDAFNALKLNIAARNASKSQALQSDWLGKLLDVKLGGMKAEANKLGEIKGSNEGYGLTGDANPSDPREQKLKEIRSEFEGLDEVKNFKYIQRLSNQLVNTLKNPSAVADPALAKMAVQLIEPGLSTTAGETSALAGSSSIPDSWKASIAKSLGGGTGLPPEVRSGLIDLMSSSYDAYGKSFANTLDLYQGEAKKYGLDPVRISNIPRPVSFEADSGNTSVVTPNPTTTIDTTKTPRIDAAGLEASLERIKAEIKNPATTPARVAELKAYANSLVNQTVNPPTKEIMQYIR